jgi:competence protein ComEC
MIFLIILAINLSTPATPQLLNNTSALATLFQKKCLSIVPHSSAVRPALMSLVCGEKITDQELAQNLSESSLIHLFVISGSHLILLDEFLSILKIPLFVRSLFLLFYSLVAGWQAPVVRALFGWSLRKLPRFRNLHLPGDLVVLATGMITLILFPTWVDSKSLIMSWCAALALTVPGIFNVRSSFQKITLAQLVIFIFMLPCLWGFGSLHPLGLLFNLLLGPAIAFLLLPLGILAIAIPATDFLFAHTLATFNALMHGLTDPIPLPQGQPWAPLGLWLWIGCLHLILHFARLNFRQGKDFSR